MLYHPFILDSVTMQKYQPYPNTAKGQKPKPVMKMYRDLRKQMYRLRIRYILGITTKKLNRKKSTYESFNEQYRRNLNIV